MAKLFTWSHLSIGPERFNECLELIKDQSLYTEALRLYPEISSEYKTVAECYGEYLLKQSKYDEAGFGKYNSKCLLGFYLRIQ